MPAAGLAAALPCRPGRGRTCLRLADLAVRLAAELPTDPVLSGGGWMWHHATRLARRRPRLRCGPRSDRDPWSVQPECRTRLVPSSHAGLKGSQKKGKNKRRVDRPATGVLLDPELAAEMLLNAPAELLPLYTLLYAWQTMSAGRPANTCTTACLSLQSALARLGIASEPRVVQATITCRDLGARVGSRHPRWNGTYWDGHMVLVLRDQGRFVDMTLHQARVLPRTGMYAAPIVGRCANPATGVPATLQPGDIAMLQRGEALIQYEALEDQGSWRGTVGEADWAGLEQNADNVISLTLDTLRGEGLIERAREAPYPKLQAALAAAKGS